MTRRRKPKVGGARAGAGRKPTAGVAAIVVRTVKLTPDQAAAHDTAAAASGQKWPDWIREAAELAIARGSTRSPRT